MVERAASADGQTKINRDTSVRPEVFITDERLVAVIGKSTLLEARAFATAILEDIGERLSRGAS